MRAIYGSPERKKPADQERLSLHSMRSRVWDDAYPYRKQLFYRAKSELVFGIGDSLHSIIKS